MKKVYRSCDFGAYKTVVMRVRVPEEKAEKVAENIIRELKKANRRLKLAGKNTIAYEVKTEQV